MVIQNYIRKVKMSLVNKLNAAAGVLCTVSLVAATVTFIEWLCGCPLWLVALCFGVGMSIAATVIEENPELQDHVSNFSKWFAKARQQLAKVVTTRLHASCESRAVSEAIVADSVVEAEKRKQSDE